VIVIVVFKFVDFDRIEKKERNKKMPKYMEWYGAMDNTDHPLFGCILNFLRDCFSKLSSKTNLDIERKKRNPFQ
jgi:uncharacterized YccA/Bax inhibitor family protein